MKTARIMVVDDEPGMLRAVERILGRKHELLCVPSALRAIDLARDFDPDLAILDIRMPDLDGFELTERLKKQHPTIDVILMTGSVSDPDQNLIRAIRRDAFYFIQKPFDSEVLVTLVARCLQLRELEEENRSHTRRLEAELGEARAFQMSLLPGREAKLGRLSIACRYESCAELGGDLYDYTLDASGAVAILVADVSGHGASAAMLTGIVKSCFRSASADGYDPLAVVQRVFAAIGAFSAEKFVTMFCARIPAGPIGPAGPSGSDAGSIEYVNAGHPAGLLWSDTRPVATLESTGPLISPALPDLKALWKKIARPIAAGDRLLVYTDGLTEAQRDDEFFGEEGIRREIANHAEGGAVLLDAILKAVSDYGGGRPKQDDFTLLAARID